MKREVRRQKVLRSFSIDISQLEALCIRLTTLFKDPKNVVVCIEIDLPNQTLKFDSVEQLMQFPGLHGKVTRFSFSIAETGRSVFISARRFLGSRPYVYALGESEAWCAGAVESAQSFVESNSLWYHWFVITPIGWMLFLINLFPLANQLAQPHGVKITGSATIWWGALLFVLFFVYVAKMLVLPTAVLEITKEETFIRKYAAEVSFGLALISVLLSVIGLLLAK